MGGAQGGGGPVERGGEHLVAELWHGVSKHDASCRGYRFVGWVAVGDGGQGGRGQRVDLLRLKMLATITSIPSVSSKLEVIHRNRIEIQIWRWVLGILVWHLKVYIVHYPVEWLLINIFE